MEMLLISFVGVPTDEVCIRATVKFQSFCAPQQHCTELDNPARLPLKHSQGHTFGSNEAECVCAHSAATCERQSLSAFQAKSCGWLRC
eukprot:3749989-Amphidinium_carterae.1